MNLIIQAIEIGNSDLRELAKISGSSQIERINGQAFRLREATRSEGVAEYCTEVGFDFAFVDQDAHLTDFGLVAMDMDSTLVSIESIDEMADLKGVKPQVAEITASTMLGEIDFAESLTRRTALLQGLDQSALQQVYDERLKLNPGAERMLQRMKSLGIRTLLISGGFTFFTDRLRERLGIDYSAANTLEIVDGKITGKVLGEIIGAQGKADVLTRVTDELGLKMSQVIAIGDGANDLKMLAEAGISIAYHAKPIVQREATYSFNHIGLDGVVNLFG
ncbi:MAG: phosphoserine phosphatase SerB [Nitrosomonadaceae bacterium]|nr:phosphoserine phosphatase SerB [Nitrosomonadaceae bacterium]